jgi:hypothetical protein
MKPIISYLLVISIGVNLYFFVYFIDYKKEYDERRKLNFWKEITYKEGYKFLEDKMKMDFPETNFKQRPYFVYFWNPSWYDFQHANAMRKLDSLATDLGEYSFNYIFATEMDEVETKAFLRSRGSKFKNFKVMGGMDDFISGVYNETPPKRKLIIGSKQQESSCPDLFKMKTPGYYLLIDTQGEILYHNYKFFPLKDTGLIRRLQTLPSVKKLESQD